MAAAGVGWWALGRPGLGQVAALTQCGSTRVPLAITASPDIAPVLTKAAAAFDSGTNSLVDGNCTTTTVTAAAPADFGDTLQAALEAQGGPKAPTAWVPDASIWREVLSRRPELLNALPRSVPVIAVSPAVIAAPRPMAEALGWPNSEPSWKQLLDLGRSAKGWGEHGHPEWGRAQIAWQDPFGDPGVLAATASLSDVVVADAESVDDVRRNLLTAQSALTSLDADPEKVFAPLRDASLSPEQALAKTPMVPMTEREVTAFNATSPKIPLAALYPSDGVQPTEVPLITINAGWVTHQQQAALDRFAEFLVVGEAAKHFAEDGWRTPRLQTTADEKSGAIASEPAYSPGGTSSASVAQVLQRWTALDRRGSVLVVLDTSGSMNEKVPAADNATRLDLAKQAITSSLPLFSDRTAVGLWTFSRRTSGNDYTSVLGLGPLFRTVNGVPARQALQQQVSALKADGATGLYDTVIAAAAEAQAGWRQGDNTIILISDGKNEDDGSATLEQVLAKLKPLTDPQHPVRILSIALGDSADAAALRKISDATGGEAYLARGAEDLDKVFLTALTD